MTEMTGQPDAKSNKQKVFLAIERAEHGATTGDIMRATKLSRPTVLAWQRALEADGTIEIARRIGRVVLWRACKNE